MKKLLLWFTLLCVAVSAAPVGPIAANRRRTGTPFSPTDIAGCVLWLKADSLALSDGASVSTWADLSGTGHDCTNSGSNRPIFKTAIINGKPIVRFASASFQKLNITTPFYPASGYSIFVVMKTTGTIFPSISTSGVSVTIPYGPFETGSDVIVSNRAGYWSFTDSNSTFQVWTNTNTSGNVLALFRNGSAVGASTGTNTSSENFEEIGARSSPGNYADGDMAELIVYDSQLGTPNRQLVETYLGAKYGLF